MKRITVTAPAAVAAPVLAFGNSPRTCSADALSVFLRRAGSRCAGAKASMSVHEEGQVMVKRSTSPIASRPAAGVLAEDLLVSFRRILIVLDGVME